MALATFPAHLAPRIRTIGFERRATIAFQVEDDTRANRAAYLRWLATSQFPRVRDN